MKNFSLILLFIASSYLSVTGQNPNWKVSSEKIITQWAGEVDTQNALPEYPRPQMERENWINLNGLWDYAVKPKSEPQPSGFDGKILVPFAIESALSGVSKTVGKDNNLWYKTTFTLPAKLKRGNVLLHFGAVDWEAEVFVNGKKAGIHNGGYDHFSFDISDLLKSGEQELVVRVWDPSDEGPQPRGKQVRKPEGIWYTPVTGIWQTVWIEAVPDTYIAGLKNTPDIDNGTLTVKTDVKNVTARDKIVVRAITDGSVIAETEVSPNQEAKLQISDMHLWSPSDPYLYDLKVLLKRGNRTIDEVSSYFGMRKISMKPDKNGVQRMLLNNEFVFQYGPLDQGWWPDGLYTAPTDEALKFDIEKTKDMGFNMIRKHVKVEPARWYYYCDKLGMLVWQDMPSGDMGNRWDRRPGVIGIATEKDRTETSKEIYNTEWKEIIDDYYNFPSIVVWVPFNEAWGQFNTKKVVEWTMQYDPTRLVNSASGGNFYEVGHIIDLHNYPDPAMPKPELFGDERIIVLGEYGGLGLPLAGHTWQDKDNWGYRNFENADKLKERYEKLISDLTPLISKGLSAAVYTQTTDVEVEVNGLMTYDRKVIKIPESFLRSLHQKLYTEKVGF